MSIPPEVIDGFRDPVRLAKLLWPKINLYSKQREILYSLWRDDEVYVPGANQMGKDFILSIAVLLFFLTRNPCRIVTTSAKDDHLRVLWGEIMQRISESAFPLEYSKGGQLLTYHREIRKHRNGKKDSLSYLVGMVASHESIASMQGHHIAQVGDGIPRTLFVSDESSSVPDAYYTMASTWANRMIVVGNTWPTTNFFRRGVQQGDKPRDPSNPSRGYYRKVIRITVDDSPNVRYARAQLAKGIEPDNSVIIPGVKTWGELQKNLSLWDKIQQTVSLHAQFYEGGEFLLFPPEFLNHAEEVAAKIPAKIQRIAKGIGIDPAEGGNKTSMCAVDEYGIIELVSKVTPNTAVIPNEAIAFMRRHQVPPEAVLFDAGGGGKQHADVLRERGYNVGTVGFGEKVSLPMRRGVHGFEERKDTREEKYVYLNRRAELFGELSILLDPSSSSSSSPSPSGFGIPRGIRGKADDPSTELRRQLSPIPKRFDQEGRLRIPPKNRKDPNRDDEECLVNLIGHSPDEADALVLAVHAMQGKGRKKRVEIFG